MTAFKQSIVFTPSYFPNQKQKIKDLFGKNFEIHELKKEQLRIDFFLQNSFDIILFACEASTMEATVDLVKNLRRESSPHSYSAIVLSLSNPSKDLIELALEAGFDLILSNELSSDQLYAELLSAFQIAQSKRDLADALEKLSLTHERLKKLSVFDELTGLHNARSISRILRAEFKRAERYASHLSVLRLDIDNFKSINENYDHLMGSYILSKVGLQINTALRGDIDFAARVGGDEFLVILPETDAHGAKMVAQRIQQKIRDTVFDNGSHRVHVSMTAGLANFDGEHGSSTITDPDRLQQIAEYDLAQAKLSRFKVQENISERSA